VSITQELIWIDQYLTLCRLQRTCSLDPSWCATRFRLPTWPGALPLFAPRRTPDHLARRPDSVFRRFSYWVNEGEDFEQRKKDVGALMIELHQGYLGRAHDGMKEMFEGMDWVLLASMSRDEILEKVRLEAETVAARVAIGTSWAEL
jgi:hypothetical protein